MNRNPHDIVKAPVITEESTIQTETRNQYVFRVDPRANKPEIRDAIERLFNVKVLSVNTCNYQGKQRRRRGCVWSGCVMTSSKRSAFGRILRCES